MMSAKASVHRQTFNLVPDLYDQIRPNYPVPMLQQIEEYAHLNPTATIVEVGPGTGQASGYFISRGYSFLGIELGADLTVYVQRKYAGWLNANFIHSSFEDWAADCGAFDLLLAAQMFHWIQMDFGVQKAAAVLKPGGAIALMWNLDESQHTEFWKRGSTLHEEYFPDDRENRVKDLSEWSRRYASALKQSPAFFDVLVVEHRWQKKYSADEWIKMRNTFSPDLSLSAEKRTEFHIRLRAIIDDLGGSFMRCYRCVCVLGRRAES